MKIIAIIIIGYLLGSVNPAAIISKKKGVSLRKRGTGNLGATNTMLNFGKKYGALVMLFDILKAFVAVKLSKLILPTLSVAGLIGGSSAVLGHVYPFHLKFKGGKGLASFAGMILGVDWVLFLFLAILTCILMIIVNYSVAMPMSAAVLFPILYGLRTGNITAFFIATAISILIVCKHYSNIGKARRGEDVKIREYIKNNLFH